MALSIKKGMKRTLNLLKTTAVAVALVGAAFAQDVRDYKWRADVNNHGWMIGTTGSWSGRPMRLVPTKWVTIHINHVAQIDNVDQGDPLGRNRADFFTMIWVDGQVYKSRNFSRDDGDPNWVLRAPVTGDTTNVRIRLWDDDDGLEQRDDHIDINPAGKAKDLILTYNAATKEISGDVTGKAGEWITSSGGGDDDRGKIGFTIR